MNTMANYLTIYVIGISGPNVALHKISLDEGAAKFTGGWILKKSDITEIKNVIFDSPIVSQGEDLNLNNTKLDMAKFLEIARNESHKALALYEEFKALEPKKRKNLVRPEFWHWPDINFENPKESLSNLGIRESIPGSDKDFEEVLSLSRLIKYVFDKWYEDEQLRLERKYLLPSFPALRLAPPNWI